jgi:predicted transposase/invertase (TIGR01784 family)
VDWTFKRVFFREAGKPLLTAMLNDFLRRMLPADITEITLLPTEILGITNDSKGAVLDIFCKDQLGNGYLVEMQARGIKHMNDRVRFYVSRVQSEILHKGDDYEMPATFFVGILNHMREPESKDVPYFTEEAWMNLETLAVAERKEFWIFVELPRFKKKLEKLDGFREKLVYLFKHLHKMKERPPLYAEKLFDHLFAVTEVSKFTDMERNQYKEALVIDGAMDAKAVYDYAYDMVKAKAERRAEKRGEKKGLTKAMLDMAKAMLAKGYSLQEVLDLTHLQQRDVLALR